MSRWRRLPAIAIALVIGLIAQELLVRAVVPGPAPVAGFSRLAYVRNGSTETTSLARRSLRWWSEPDGASFVLRTNSYGFRDREWRLRPGSSPRVALFGDSMVEGLGAPEGGTIGEALARRAELAGTTLEVMNFGASGFGPVEYRELVRDAVELFRPDHAVLVVYMNDFYALPLDGPIPPRVRPFRRRSFWTPRLLSVWSAWKAGDRVPTRWPEQLRDPEPLDLAWRLRDDPNLAPTISAHVDPILAESMLRGSLNPAVHNLLARSARVLPEPPDPSGFVATLGTLLRERGVAFYVVYLPSLNQVSDRYLEAQRRLSRPIEETSLLGSKYQRQARSLSIACRREGVPFLDLTPDLRRAEDTLGPLYWSYDGHMNQVGYAVVAETIARSWLPSLEKRGPR